MILILKADFTDGCTYYTTDYVPIEYESPEAAIVDFEKAVKGNDNGFWNSDFIFGGVKFDASDYIDMYRSDKYSEPTFLTLEEWIARFKHK